MAKACCVCSESKESTENRLFSCSSHGCDVTVHQGCYGIVHAPTGLWFCRKCESQERAARVKCELCPTKEGALKRTDSGSWAHVVCALYIPEVTFGNNRRMEPIVTTKVPRERFSKSCYICEERGMETQATYGACMACHKSSCRLAFHVTCAQKEHLLCEEEDQRDSRNIVYCGYCSTHHKKMMRQKLKQGLRKYPTTPTSSTAPPLPPTTAPPLPPSATTPAIATAPQLSTLSDLTKERDQKPLQIKDRELPQKRPSTDAPILQHKRKYRRRKLSSSNESTTSEAPSNASDIPPPPAANIPLSPFSVTPRSPPSSHTTHTGCKVKGEAMECGGAELLPSSSSSSLTQKADMSESKSHPLSPVTDAQAPSLEATASLDAAPSGEDVALSRKQGGSTSSDQSSINRTALGAPPRSLHELLERQWEQTAQFILDQAGRQNNAGMMLAHLHQLQSENSRMQSRIMELASQREFYIAINTRLRQTLVENDNRLPNGVQPSLGEGIQQSLQNTTPNLSSSTAASESQSQTGPATDTLVDISSTQLSSNSLSKSAQESLLQAHFLTASLPARGLHYPLLPTGQGGSIPSNQTHSMDMRPQQPHVLHLQQNDTTQGGVFPAHVVTSQPPTGSLLRGTSAHKGERLGQLPSGDVTHVTNTVQVPIVTYPPLPSRGMNALPSSISEPQSAANHSFYGRTFNSDKT